MVSEDLYISTIKIEVHYQFLNKSNRDLNILVAFPLPDLKMDPDDDVTVIPSDDPVNFVDFVTTVNGQPVHANVEQKAYLKGTEITETLMRLGVPLSPYRFRDASEKSPASRTDQLKRLGLVNDAGIPLWTVKTTFYWHQRFPSGQQTLIEHRYKPSVGGVVPVESKQLLEWFKDGSYQKYCIDADFLQTLARDKVNTFEQNTLEYVLKTGANWSGPIKDFRLVVDKGSPDNLVSFCGQNVKKIGPTQFEMTKRNFTPTANLAILILKREAPIGPAPASPNTPAPQTDLSQLGTESCDDLWYQRNAIFKAAGYCFKLPRAIQTFGNAGCQFDNEGDVPLSDKQRQLINQIRSAEAARRCSR